MLQAGLQFDSTPPTGMAALLQLPTSEGINDATVSLAAALADTEGWREFDRLSAELNDDDRLALRQAIQRINELLAPAKVNEFEPDRMARRERFRIDQVDTVIQTLGGRPREFADSFQSVDDLIDLVAIEVFGQIVTRGAPIELATIDDLEIDGPNVRFVNSGQAYLPAGSLTRLPDPLVPEVVIVDSWAITSDPATGSVISPPRKAPAWKRGRFHRAVSRGYSCGEMSGRRWRKSRVFLRSARTQNRLTLTIVCVSGDPAGV